MLPRNRWTVPVLEALFWLPPSLLPFAVRWLTGQYTHRAEPFVALFVPLLLIYLLARTGRFQPALRAILLVFLVVGGVFALGLALAGMGAAQPDLVLAALDTNPGESGEFLRRFYTAGDYALVAVLMVLPVASFITQWRLKAFWQPKPRAAVPLAVLLVLQIALVGNLRTLLSGERRLSGIGNELIGQIYPASWYPPLRPWIELVQAARLRAQMATASGSFTDLTPGVRVLEPAVSPRTYVVVVTESVGRSHLGLYGYPRDTTPRLSALARNGELTVFTDAITSQAQTAVALFESLTWTSPSQPNPRGVIDLFTAAGFETTWISNQPGMGMFDSVASLLTRGATHRVFLKHPTVVPPDDLALFKAPERAINERFRANFDDRVLPELAKVLEDPVRDKLIVIHLMGSHSLYRARYPASEEVFTTTTRPELTAAENQVINEYDNSVRFGDMVIGAVIDQVRGLGGESLVVALSDHGQEVYDFRDFAGHTNAVLSPWMLEIPLVAWLSPDYRAHHRDFAAMVTAAASRPYIHRNFAASLTDLGRIGYMDLATSASIFSKDFVASPRIAAGRDYATFMRDWAPDAAHASGMALLPPKR
ncbi:MAG: phosphoethanolamine transferase [Acidobacteria bacterium]|nr:MAG: phosphoethanolamine transferase [Acidobacteriota bacterium]